MMGLRHRRGRSRLGVVITRTQASLTGVRAGPSSLDMIIDITAATTQLSELLDRAVAGEEIIITRAGKPMARLAALGPPIGELQPVPAPSGMGSLRGRIWMASDSEDDSADITHSIEEGQALRA